WLGTSPVRAGMDSPCRRAELEEGKSLYVLSCHNEPDRGSAHGARHKDHAPRDNHGYCLLVKEPGLLIDRLRPVYLWEPPGADPHAGLCGG
ncbi:MAG: hypothetical protein MUO31_15575, partial [Thermodesulfovibrionales bacterium]|nr:hypothetical protein [Thermodesulfovibrionales bacterium]